MPFSSGKLDHYLIHGDHKAIVAHPDDKEAKHARLTYSVMRHTQTTTFVQIELETGRYHQIRAQFSASGHPIVGDQKYGAQQISASIHLHSAKLAFLHPTTKEFLEFEAPAPFS